MKQSKFKKVAFLSLALIVFWFNGKTQIPQSTLNIQSPNAASLGLFGEVPVSLFTGVPEIGIPLYNLSEGKINIPISMNYHASGFRPDQHPGWVGMGWSLSAGGMISRVVEGLSDEYNYEDNQILGYWNSRANAKLNNNNWSQSSYLINSYAYITNGLINGLLDSQPDKFSFNFPGYSGEFYLNANGQWKVKCDKPVKITFSDSNPLITPPFPYILYIKFQGLMKTFKGFTITTEDGTQYIFGNTANAIEYSIPFFNQQESYWTAGSWYLTKIISPTGQTANFTYERGQLINQMTINNYEQSESQKSIDGGNFFTNFLIGTCFEKYVSHDIRDSYSGSLIAPVYLKSIQTDNGTLQFNRSISNELKYGEEIFTKRYTDYTNIYGVGDPTFLPYVDKGDWDLTLSDDLDSLKWNKLDSICIRNNNGTKVKTYSFDYNNIDTERLKLLSITEKGIGGETGGIYSFAYDESKILPNYLENKTDHWGFWNNSYASITNRTTYYSNREPNADYLFAGTLKKIVYPTGGTTEFIYEPNSYSTQVGLNRSVIPQPDTYDHLAGGLRIKKIINYEDYYHSDKKTEKEYFYLKEYSIPTPTNTLSSGVLGGQIQYYFDAFKMQTLSPQVMYSENIFSSQSVLPMTINSAGSHIGYTTVIEKRSDNSYTKFTFSNYNNGAVDDPAEMVYQPNRTPYEPYNSREEERGKLLKEEMYNSSDQLIKKRELNYIALNKENEYVKSVKKRILALCETGDTFVEFTAFKLYTYSFLPNTETETIYDPINSSSISTNKQFTYDPTYRLLKTTSTVNSEGKNLITSLKYPFDMILGSDPNGTYQSMVNKNITGPVVEQTQTVANTQVKFFRTNYYNPSSSSLYLPQTIEVQNENYPIETRFRYHSYDNKGNILTMSNEKGTKTSYVYDYKSLYPIAEVKNADANLIAYTSFEADGTGNWVVPSPIRDSLCTAVTGKKSYDLTNGNITKGGLDYIKPYIVSYWSLNGGRKVNGQSPTITGRSINGWTYYEHSITSSTQITVSGNGLIDELRLYPADAQMTTYSYSPLIGIKEKCDVNNNITYFSYDNFGKLAKIKDFDKNILKEYTYNFGSNPLANGVYWNTLKKQPIAKNNCPYGLGSIENIQVDARTYSSSSQEDADQLAQNYINTAGQNVANTNGNCDKILTIALDQQTDIFQLKFCTITIRDVNSNIVYTKYLNTISYPFTIPITDSPSYTVTIVPGRTPLEVFVNGEMKDVTSAQTWSQVTGNISILLSSIFY